MTKFMKKLFAFCLAAVLMAVMLPVQTEAAAVRLNRTKATVYTGSSITLKLNGASGKKQWRSSNPSVAAVSHDQFCSLGKRNKWHRNQRDRNLCHDQIPQITKECYSLHMCLS